MKHSKRRDFEAVLALSCPLFSGHFMAVLSPIISIVLWSLGSFSDAFAFFWLPHDNCAPI
jgi:hypothetical protein